MHFTPRLTEISRITMANAESGADQADRGMRKEYFNSSGAGKFLPPVLKLLELVRPSPPFPFQLFVQIKTDSKMMLMLNWFGQKVGEGGSVVVRRKP